MSQDPYADDYDEDEMSEKTVRILKHSEDSKQVKFEVD